MSDRPLIGVTTSEMRVAQRVEQTPQGEPPRKEMALGLAYMRAIESAGGLPLVIPPMPLAAISPLIDQLHGICLSGGPDLHPATYGAEPHPELGPTEPDLDEFELALTREAHSRNVPVLAICRGMQVLNVATGGTLMQHLPDGTDGTVEHRQPAPGEQVTHPVDVASASLAAHTLGEVRMDVNSFHHQAIGRLGRGVLAVAWSPDGVVEAIELPAREFCLGVQWHAESLIDRPEGTRLFEGLVDAARRHARLQASLAA
jgi:putative glutamine amidotransferase